MKRKLQQQAQEELTKSQKRRNKEFKVAPHVFEVLSSLVPTMLSDPGIEDCALDVRLLEKGTQDRLEEGLTEKQRKQLRKKIYRGRGDHRDSPQGLPQGRRVSAQEARVPRPHGRGHQLTNFSMANRSSRSKA
jgi:hypothetical protein